MEFLTPWFLAGIGAVSLPIVFHMIRRTPKGRMPFSTLMFLEPSPPRITSRSKLDHWLLLLLRAAALILLALAFGRPFWRAIQETSDSADSGRRVAVVIDTSASMRRADLWERAIDAAKKQVQELGEHDRLAVYAFDRELRTVFSFDEWSQVDDSVRKELITKRIDELKPGWGKTDLGHALAHVSELLDALSIEESQTSDSAPRQIVVISDVQAGASLAALRGYVWPERVGVTLERIVPGAETNVGIQLVGFHKQNAFQEDAQVRVRVSNSNDSTAENFKLAWLDADGSPIATAEADVYVAPGEARIVRAPMLPDGRTSSRLRLSGDEHDFDNTAYIQSAVQRQLNVMYLGGEWRDEIDSAAFLSEFMFPEHRYRRINVIEHNSESSAVAVDAKDVRMALVTRALTSGEGKMLNAFAASGGTVVFAPATAEQFSTLSLLLDDPSENAFVVVEANVDGYAMFASVNFEHPLLAPFAEANFTDFTSIHVWNHREFDVSQIGECDVMARFDGGQPAIVSKTLGRGRLVVFATSWNTVDSQLAQSSKLSPLLNVILEHDAGGQPIVESYSVGDAVPVAHWRAASGAVSVTPPQGEPISVEESEASFSGTGEPGVYKISAGEQSVGFVVNVDPDESKTSPLPKEELEALGVLVSNGVLPNRTGEMTDRERQMRSQELEKQQKLWRWLVLAALVFLFAETWLSKRIVVRSTN